MFSNHSIKAIAIIGVVVILLVAFAEWERSLLILIAFLSIAWILILLFAFKGVESKRSVHMLLRMFRRKVDHASQQLKAGVKIDDQTVLKAFDELNAEIQSLLQTKKTDMARLKRDVMAFLYPVTLPNVYWRPPPLRELGYLLDICKQYSKDAPVLALYKFSAEEPIGDGDIMGTYAIISKDTALSFPLTIRIRVQSPDSVDMDSPGSSHHPSALPRVRNNVF
jgi:hypothetical protein